MSVKRIILIASILFVILLAVAFVVGGILWPVSDNNVFWQAVGSISAAYSAFFVFFQLMQFVSETRQKEIESFRYANEVLGSDEFLDAVRAYNEVLTEGASDLKNISAPAFWILKTVDIVAILISNGHLPKNLILRHEGRRLATVYEQLMMVASSKNPSLPDAELIRGSMDQFPEGFELLQEANNWYQKLGK